MLWLHGAPAADLPGVITGAHAMNLCNKSPAIVELIAAIRSRYPDSRVRIVDYWPEDPHTIGFQRPMDDDGLVSVSTKGKSPGCYDVFVDIPDEEARSDPYLGSGSYSDCVIDGVLATIRKYVVRPVRGA